MRGIKLQCETGFCKSLGLRPFRALHGLDIMTAGHGITLICDCTLTYRVREFEEHGITSGSICTFTYHVPENGAPLRFPT